MSRHPLIRVEGLAKRFPEPSGKGTLTVFEDKDDRWMPARRILNQDAYHVTNVNEDGTIPQREQPHVKVANGFRTQARIEPDGSVCQARP